MGILGAAINISYKEITAKRIKPISFLSLMSLKTSITTYIG